VTNSFAFCSRSEYRLLLRPDNADIRLTAKGYAAGCVSESRMSLTKATQKELGDGVSLLSNITFPSSTWKKLLGGISISDGGTLKSAWSVLKNSSTPPLSQLALKHTDIFSSLQGNIHLCQRLHIQAHYEDLIERQLSEIRWIEREENLTIPRQIPYERLCHISSECREELIKSQPLTVSTVYYICL
jgi:tRNA uridine 5-carboxymethylaminomethyl modification enzyme